MAEEDPNHSAPTSNEPTEAPLAPLAQDNPRKTADRSVLLAQARTFLTSPPVIRQSLPSKRIFLAQKGLNGSEIELLLQKLPASLPPRTYPRPPPSNLPVLLLGLLRLFSWLAGGSAVLLLIYHRFLLPRITRTSQARQSLKHHQVSLLRSFNERLSSFQKIQTESFQPLPSRLPYREPEEYHACNTLGSVRDKYAEKLGGVPDVTVLRCTISELKKLHDGKDPSAEELLAFMQTQLKLEGSPESEDRMRSLWNTLTTSECFMNDEAQIPLWSYKPPVQPINPMFSSLQELSSSTQMLTPAKSNTDQSIIGTSLTPAQRTLQSLTSLTADISREIYAPVRHSFPGGPVNGTGPEEDIRREIRALKGLVLNRRTFMSSRPPSRVMTEPVGTDRPDA